MDAALAGGKPTNLPAVSQTAQAMNGVKTPYRMLQDPVYALFMKHNHPPQNQNQSQNPAATSRPAATALSQNEINFTPAPDEVARRAYFAYENQGSQPGHEVQHWLQAEAELIAERNRTRTHSFHDQQ
ncbi:MAG TPA: DUF2934 domain-containing protein [Verrucomicrobiae bacterium]